MAGKRRVFVFSQAGGTGRSYHSDLEADNQQRRVLYCVEPGWSSARCVQGMGRVHRANQACPPELVLSPPTSKPSAASSPPSRVAARPARCAHEGPAADGEPGTLALREFNLETPLSRASLHNWFIDLYRGEGRAVASGVTPALVEEQMGIRVLDQDGQLNVGAVPEVPKFLNRLLSLQTGAMDAVFDSGTGTSKRLPSPQERPGRSTWRRDHPGRARGQDRRASRLHARAVWRDDAGRDAGAHPADGDRGLDEIWRWAKDAQALGSWVGFVVNRRSGQPYALFRAGSRTTETGRVVRRPPPGRRAVEPAHGRDRRQPSRGADRRRSVWPPTRTHR